MITEGAAIRPPLFNQLLKAFVDLNKIPSLGYDGFIAKMDNSGVLEYAVVDPKQVKIRR